MFYSRAGRARRPQLTLEALEDRSLLSATGYSIILMDYVSDTISRVDPDTGAATLLLDGTVHGFNFDDDNDLTVAPDGTVYFTTDSQRDPNTAERLFDYGLYRLDTAGNVLTQLIADVAGSVAMAPNGNVAFMDYGSEQIYWLDATTGTPTLAFDGPVHGFNFDDDSDVTVDAAGNLVFTSDTALRDPNTFARIGPWGLFHYDVTGGVLTQVLSDDEGAVAMHPDGDIVFQSQGDDVVYRVDPLSAALTPVASGNFGDDSDVAAAANGDVIYTSNGIFDEDFQQIAPRSLYRYDAQADSVVTLIEGVEGSVAVLADVPLEPSTTTATIGFWQNPNGQALIEGLNGSSQSTLLSQWLSDNFSNLFGHLAGMTNADVAEAYQQVFAQTGKGPKLEAQVLAVALACYVTTDSLVSVNFVTGTPDAGLVAQVESYGFDVTSGGVGELEVNVGNSGAAFGLADGDTARVIDLLVATDGMSLAGLGYDDLDQDTIGDGKTSKAEHKIRAAANEVYSAINEQGGI